MKPSALPAAAPATVAAAVGETLNGNHSALAVDVEARAIPPRGPAYLSFRAGTWSFLGDRSLERLSSRGEITAQAKHLLRDYLSRY